MVINGWIKWHDSDGEKYNCEYYEKHDKCKSWGDDYAWPSDSRGKTANEACCACDGGEMIIIQTVKGRHRLS